MSELTDEEREYLGEPKPEPKPEPEPEPKPEVKQAQITNKPTTIQERQVRHLGILLDRHTTNRRLTLSHDAKLRLIDNRSHHLCTLCNPNGHRRYRLRHFRPKIT